ncbi:MAG: LysM peptidoglycan-binding domain-containing protein [Propionibacteriales bacterium]|nr:LysM peptidoglycan-binding domain-containing protein [Propionibacteriales bacterium]
MRWIRGGLAALTLLAAIFGIPSALVTWGSYPHNVAALRFDDGSALLAVLTVVGWIAWGIFTIATVAELIAQLGGRVVQLPGLKSTQLLVGGLIALVIAALPLTRAALPAPPLTASGPVPVLVDTAPEPVPVSTPDAVPATEAAIQNPGYTVVAGDDLWTISERLLGDGRQWRILTALNPALSDPLAELTPGTVLQVPEATPLKVTTAATTTHVVERGDTLSELAEEHLGAASRWPKIAQANPIIEDPDHIEIGWKLEIPGVAKPPVAEPETTPPRSTPSTHRPDADPDPLPAPTTSTAETPTSATAMAPAESVDPATPLTIGTLAAAAVVGSLELRRVLRQRERALGRHVPPASAAADRLRTALRAGEDPDALTALTNALRLVGRHCHAHSLPLPALASARVGADRLWLDWAEGAGSPPPGFDGDDQTWDIPILSCPPAADAPCPYPALVSLGTAEDGEVLLIDLERPRVLGVSGSADQRTNALSAMGVELACAPWSSEARIVAAGDGAALLALAGDDRVQVASTELGLAKLRQVIARRRAALARVDLGELRVDPERADAVAAYIFCFFDDLAASILAEVEALLDGPAIGVSVITGATEDAPAQWQVGGPASRPEGRLAGRPGSLAAHTIDADVRDQLGELFTDPGVERAPWWNDQNVYPMPSREGDEVEIVRLLEPTAHPRLLLIGPAELPGAAGPEPTRSKQQLIELCAWLIEHPHSTAGQMAAGMAVAESTRRSNLSRLRNWLGNDPDGEPYLPDAYSGRISLHPGITSDWQQLQLLLAPGVLHLADSTLVAALELVRGAPLADAAPGQWYWAEELRTDISAALRDVGVVLTDRALQANDLDLARWAAARALIVAPEDELLLAARIRTEHQAGNVADVERLVNQVTRQARVLGVDLMPETIELCQQVIEGRPRVRA